MLPSTSTVDPFLKDYPIGHKNVVFQDRSSLVRGLIILKFRHSARYMQSFKMGGLMEMVSQDRFHCTCPIVFTPNSAMTNINITFALHLACFSNLNFNLDVVAAKLI